MGRLKLKLNLLLYVGFFATLSIQSLIELPMLGDKLQLPEIIFSLIFFVTLFSVRSFKSFRFNVIDSIALLYPMVAFVNYIIVGVNSILLEVVGGVYLFLVYYLFSRFLVSTRWTMPRVISLLMKIVIGASVLLTLVAYWSFILNGHSILIRPFPNYPYLGDVIRVRGLARDPNMLMSITAISVLCLLGIEKWKDVKYWILAGTLVCLATLSKSNVILAACLFIWAIGSHTNLRRPIKLMLTALIGLTTVFVFLIVTLFVFKSSANEDGSSAHDRLLGNDALTNVGALQIYGTSYYFLKRSMVMRFPQNWIKGTGLSQFRNQIDEYKAAGEYPEHLFNYDPHDSYLGFTTESGLAGLLFLLLFGGITWRGLFSSAWARGDRLQIALGLLLIYMVIEATCLDTWNFRQYWIVLAILQAGLLSSERTEHWRNKSVHESM